MSTLDPVAERSAPGKYPSGPRPLPVLGHLLDMRRDTLGFLETTARIYGDVAAIKLGGFPAVLVSDPVLIEQVLVKQHEKFIKNRVFWRQLEALLGNGLFTAEDGEWQRQRKLAAPAFATRPLQDYAPHMVDMAERMVSSWQDGQEIDIHREMMALGLLIAAKTLLDADVTADLEKMEQAAYWVIDEVAARFARPVVIPDWVPLPGHLRYGRGIAYLEDMVYRVIAEHRSGRAEPTGFLSLLMNARDEDGKPLGDRQLRDEICNMLLAGYETSALSMSWGFHMLGQHRDIQDRVAAEVRAVVGDRPVRHDDLAALKLTENTIVEILRILPPGWAIGREAREDVHLGDYRIPKGTTVILSPWVTQRDPELFPDPLTFDPDRWTGETRRALPRFAYFPFGGGPRICIGNRFAMMEAMLLLATIVKRFDVERLTERPVAFQPSITLRPKGGIWVKLHERA